MNPRGLQPNVPSARPPRSCRGSVLVIVLWVSFGLVSLALYFAHSMSLELRAADNRIAAAEAAQAIAGAARYVSNLLATMETPGTLPDPELYRRDTMPVGDATFWLIGRGDGRSRIDQPVFSLSDEGAKLNLNTATAEMLELLPRMTPELAAAIIDWRDSDSEPTSGGAEDEIYARNIPAYRCKNSNFESIDELRLVYGMTMEILLGEDANRNGSLDPNENDGDASYPRDNRDGRLDPGLLEYVTVFSRDSATRTNGEARIAVSDSARLATLFEERFGTERANAILANTPSSASGGQSGGQQGGQPGGPQGGQQGATNATARTYGSLLEYYIASGMTADEFAQVEGDLTASTNSTAAEGLINVNTASETVLACIPGIGVQLAPSVVSYRQSNPARLNSMAWIVDVLGQTNAVQAGPYITGRTYQFTADVAALGHHGRGYQRVRFTFDTSSGTPQLVYRQDLTHLGWALGTEALRSLQFSQTTRGPDGRRTAILPSAR